MTMSRPQSPPGGASPGLFGPDDLLARAVIVVWAMVVFAFWVPLQQPISWRWFEQAARLLVGDGTPGDGPGGLHLFESHPEFQFGPVAVVAAAFIRFVGGSHAMTLARVLAAALAPVV